MSTVARFVRSGTIAALLLAASAFPLQAGIQIERIFMPLDASPSSFAIGLPGGVSFCFDPVRGAVSYVWTGGFIDPTPARPAAGKFIHPVKLLGPVMYRESGFAPLRRGDPARVPVVEFDGYTLRDDAVEFRYSVDGTRVREEVRAHADGKGLSRRLHIEGGADATWWRVIDGRPAVALEPDASGVFVIEPSFAKDPK